MLDALFTRFFVAKGLSAETVQQSHRIRGWRLIGLAGCLFFLMRCGGSVIIGGICDVTIVMGDVCG